MGGGLVHQIEVERPVYLAGIMTAEGIFPQMYVIVIGAERGAETGVHVSRDGPDVGHGDVTRQQTVEFVYELLHIDIFTFDLEMGHHHRGVHAGIGPACPHNFYRLAEQGGKGALQFFLHGIAVGLYLPTVIGGAIKSEGDEVSLCHIDVWWRNAVVGLPQRGGFSITCPPS